MPASYRTVCSRINTNLNLRSVFWEAMFQLCSETVTPCYLSDLSTHLWCSDKWVWSIVGMMIFWEDKSHIGWRRLSYGMLHRVATGRTDGGGSKHPWNVCQFLPHHTTQHPEDSCLHTRRCENVKSYTHQIVFPYNSGGLETITVYKNVRKKFSQG
jgi:hypothetical protein